MEIAEIKKWLGSDMDYNAGIALYEKFAPKKTFLALFKSGKSSFTISKLQDELRSIYTQLNNGIAPVISNIETPVIKSQKQIELSKLPKELQDLYARNGVIIRNISMLNGRLQNCKTDTERETIAAEIVALTTERRNNFSYIDHYGKYNEVVSTSAEVLNKNEATLKELLLVRAQCSRLKKNEKRKNDYEAALKRKLELEQILEVKNVK